MGLYQPTVIAPSSLNGTGVIDATQDMTVTFQINGTVPIYGWQFFIYENTVESTEVYRSAIRHKYYHLPGDETWYEQPIYGKDMYGNAVPFSDTITAADLATAGVTNGFAAGYTLRVDQIYHTYSAGSNVPVDTRLNGVNRVFFETRSSVAFNMTNWQSAYGRKLFFLSSLVPISASESDPLICYRWRLALQNSDHPIVEDTGSIYTTRRPFIYYGTKKNGTDYSVRLNGTLESGMELDSGWHDFSVNWTETAPSHAHMTAYYVRNMPCFYIRITADDGYDLPNPAKGWEVYRVRTEDNEMEIAGIIPPGQTAMYDFGAKNNTEYIYKAYYADTNTEGYTLTTENPVKMRQYWNWAVIETEPEETEYTSFPQTIDTIYIYNKMFHVKRVHQFQGNVNSGQVSNENEPFVENNFTPYPTVQKSARKGLSGTLKAWVGRTRNGVFSDSVEEVDRIMDLSTRDTVKFLRDRKGNLRMIEIGDAIRKETQDPYGEQPVEVQIPWVEVGDAKGCQIVSMVEDGLIAPGDDIVDTETAISEDEDGYIEWTMDDEGYAGSEIEMDADGNLVQKYNDDMTYVPAELEIDGDGKLKGTTVIDAEE